jgi:hypothetical protein
MCSPDSDCYSVHHADRFVKVCSGQDPQVQYTKSVEHKNTISTISSSTHASQLVVPTPAPPSCSNLVYNGNFNAGENHWSEYNHSPRINGFHTHNFGGITTGHLHGHCPSTGGGIQQSIHPMVVGQEYTLKFKAWSGSWDGHDTDYVQAMIAGHSWNVGVDHMHEVQDGPDAYQQIVHHFTATSVTDNLRLYAAHTQCINVDDIIVMDSRCDAVA